MSNKNGSHVLWIKLTVAIVLSIIAITWFFGLPHPLISDNDIETFSVVSTPSKNLRLMTYNIHYGRGMVHDLDFRTSKEHIISNLDAIIELIKSNNVDVVAIQEIDFNAARSHYIEEVNYIAKKAGFPYVARAIDWDVKYLPFPYWPPKKHIGKIKSGVAVFSKYPIEKNTRYLLEKRVDKSGWYNLFYLDRLTQEVVIDVNGKKVTLLNTHFEAFNGATREIQAKEIIQLVSNTDSKNIVLLGDFNAIPPSVKKKVGYPDEPEVNYNDDVIAMLREGTGMVELDDAFTHPANLPNRKLDYIFVSDSFNILYKKTINDAGGISDHLPVFVELEIK